MRVHRWGPVAAALAVFAFAAASAGANPTTHQLETAVFDPDLFLSAGGSQALVATRSAGASTVRLYLGWSEVAPKGTTKPTGFDATNPADPKYNWTRLDRLVRDARTAGLEPIVGFAGAPQWAERSAVGPEGARNPDPAAFGQFMQAAARRYTGSFIPAGTTSPLPRVRYWKIWNEPNLDWFFMPQFDGATALSPAWYRELVNIAADAVHGVRADNLVVAGGLTPYGDAGRAVWPLRFMRELFCLPGSATTNCAPVKLDVWAHHPYSNGGPQWQAWDPDGGSMGDLPEVRSVLDAAIAGGRVSSVTTVRFWATEFSWDSNLPDPSAVPMDLHQRWVAEAMYRMWRNGISLVTWFTLRDSPLGTSMFQSGLYFLPTDGSVLGAPKPSLQAFRFPFVALPENGRAFVWGRTPDSQPAYVAIEALVNGTWTHFAVLRANRHGIFMGRVPIYFPADHFRVRHGNTNETSVPFALTPPPNNDLVLATPFGAP